MNRVEEVSALEVECPRCKAKAKEHCDLTGSREQNEALRIPLIHPARLAKSTLEPGHYVVTVTGKRIYLENPNPRMIDIHDIAHGLSNICRFHGQTREFYSVAEHCVLVASLMPHSREYQLVALLHDAEEAYTGDTPQPVKEIYKKASMGAVERLEGKLLDAIFAGLLGPYQQFPDAVWREVVSADKRLAIHEMETYGAENFYDPIMDTRARYLPHQLQLGEPLSPKEAKFEFLQCYAALMTSWGQHISERTGNRVLFKGPSATHP